jgi:peptidoglycan hydrolase-like protein with peptidoglycan-binding domain
LAVSSIAVGVCLVAAGWWAGQEALQGPPDPLADVAPLTFQVGEETVGRSLSFAAVAEWLVTDGPASASAGTVTSIEFKPGATVDVGDVLFTVNLRPVVAAEGQIPAFRSISSGDKGADVAQLQTLLAVGQFYAGEIDGDFGFGTVEAVRKWHTALGLDDDGSVQQGDVVFFPELQARVVAGEQLKVGATLDGGEVAIRIVETVPQFWIPLSVEQRSLVPLSAAVNVLGEDSEWEARIVRAEERTEEGQLDLVLEAKGGGPVCGSVCEDTVPLTSRSNFPARVVVIPDTTGPVVPTAALVTGPDGSLHVVMGDGTQRQVQVLASTDGLAVVAGVQSGETIQLPSGG